MGIAIPGVGGAAPARIVTNDELAQRFGVTSEWIFGRTGITERRVVGPEESTASLAVEAGAMALRRANLAPTDVAMLIVATATPEQLCPATSAFVQRELGLTCPAFDLNAECTGFVYGLVAAMGLLDLGVSPILLIGSDTHSLALNPEDRDTCVLLGDGAGAAVLEWCEDDTVMAWNLGCNGAGTGFLHIPAGGSRMPTTAATVSAGMHHLVMDGRLVYTWGTNVCAESATQALAAAGLSAGEVDHFVPHQANLRMIKSIMRTAGLPAKSLVANLSRYGNTSSGSIPLALSEAVEAGRIQSGDVVMMSGFGAGMTWGTMLLRWQPGGTVG